MERVIGAGVRAARRGWVVGRLAWLMLALVAAICTLASAAPADAHASSAHQLCSRFLSTAEVARISGLGTMVYGKVVYPKRDGVPDGNGHQGNIPGSVCQWIDNPSPSEGLNNTAQLLVGYGASRADWNKLVRYFKAGPSAGYPIGITAPTTYRALTVGYGSKAFLLTVNLTPYYGGMPPEFKGGYLYMVCVLTARHDIMQAWFANVDAATTESWVQGVVKTDRKFF